MQFKRWGTTGAQPVFQVKRPSGNVVMVPAVDLLQFEVGNEEITGYADAKSDGSVYRYDIAGISHPDARLIVSAPDLFAFVERIANWQSSDAVTPDLREEAALLIAKITGEPED